MTAPPRRARRAEVGHNASVLSLTPKAAAYVRSRGRPIYVEDPASFRGG